jgi:hypothetical protein
MLQLVWQQNSKKISGVAIGERRLIAGAIDVLLHSLSRP